MTRPDPPAPRDPREPVYDAVGYMRALGRFMADARDTLDDQYFAAALPLLEALRRLPEPRDPFHDDIDQRPAGDHHEGDPR